MRVLVRIKHGARSTRSHGAVEKPKSFHDKHELKLWIYYTSKFSVKHVRLYQYNKLIRDSA
jgi:hypothetical protein